MADDSDSKLVQDELEELVVDAAESESEGAQERAPAGGRSSNAAESTDDSPSASYYDIAPDTEAELDDGLVVEGKVEVRAEIDEPVSVVEERESVSEVALQRAEDEEGETEQVREHDGNEEGRRNKLHDEATQERGKALVRAQIDVLRNSNNPTERANAKAAIDALMTEYDIDDPALEAEIREADAVAEARSTDEGILQTLSVGLDSNFKLDQKDALTLLQLFEEIKSKEWQEDLKRSNELYHGIMNESPMTEKTAKGMIELMKKSEQEIIQNRVTKIEKLEKGIKANQDIEARNGASPELIAQREDLEAQLAAQEEVLANELAAKRAGEALGLTGESTPAEVIAKGRELRSTIQFFKKEIQQDIANKNAAEITGALVYNEPKYKHMAESIRVTSAVEIDQTSSLQENEDITSRAVNTNLIGGPAVDEVVAKPESKQVVAPTVESVLSAAAIKTDTEEKTSALTLKAARAARRANKVNPITPPEGLSLDAAQNAVEAATGVNKNRAEGTDIGDVNSIMAGQALSQEVGKKTSEKNNTNISQDSQEKNGKNQNNEKDGQVAKLASRRNKESSTKISM